MQTNTYQRPRTPCQSPLLRCRPRKKSGCAPAKVWAHHHSYASQGERQGKLSPGAQAPPARVPFHRGSRRSRCTFSENIPPHTHIPPQPRSSTSRTLLQTIAQASSTNWDTFRNKAGHRSHTPSHNSSNHAVPHLHCAHVHDIEGLFSSALPHHLIAFFSRAQYTSPSIKGEETPIRERFSCALHSQEGRIPRP